MTVVLSLSPQVRAAFMQSVAALVVLCLSSSECPAQQVRTAPQSAQTFVSAADQAYGEGRFQEAVKLYTQAAKVLPGESSIFLGRGMAYEMLRDTRNAAEDYARAIQSDAGNYQAMECLAAIYERMGNKDVEAVALYRRALQLDPRPQWKENLTVAIEILRTRHEGQPPSAATLWNLGNEAAKKGDLNHAESLYAQAVARDPLFYQAYFSRGLVRLKKRDSAAAVADFDAGIALDPRYPGAFVHRGLAHEELGHLDLALDDFQRAARFDSWDPQGFYHLGRMLEKANDPGNALRAYEKGLTLNPKHDLPRLLNERITALRPAAAAAQRAGRSPTQRTLW